MNSPLSQTAFRAPIEDIVGEVLAHLRLAGRLPLRVSCRCLAYWDDPALDHLRIAREVDLGICGDLAAAMTVARKAVASGLIEAGCDAGLRLLPQFVIILDAEHGLVLAGEVQAGAIRWCAPVGSDAQARCVLREACGLRTKARAAMELGDPAAAAVLLTCVRALEGRLVDPFWRDQTAIAVNPALAA